MSPSWKLSPDDVAAQFPADPAAMRFAYGLRHEKKVKLTLPSLLGIG